MRPTLSSLTRGLQAVRVVAALGRFVRHPNQLDSVFAVSRSLRDTPLDQQMQRHLLADPRMAALVAEGWRPPVIGLPALEAMPAGSLGHTYAHHMKAHGLDPEDLGNHTPIRSSRDYVVHRLRETHDILHVLTGFGTDGVGELGLQAFNLAQHRSPLAVMLIFGGLMKTLLSEQPLAPLLRALSKGFELGLAARCLVTFRYEDRWERPLSEWRREVLLPEHP